MVNALCFSWGDPLIDPGCSIRLFRLTIRVHVLPFCLINQSISLRRAAVVAGTMVTFTPKRRHHRTAAFILICLPPHPPSICSPVLGCAAVRIINYVFNTAHVTRARALLLCTLRVWQCVALTREQRSDLRAERRVIPRAACDIGSERARGGNIGLFMGEQPVMAPRRRQVYHRCTIANIWGLPAPR
jgi:hypothetical protein